MELEELKKEASKHLEFDLTINEQIDYVEHCVKEVNRLFRSYVDQSHEKARTSTSSRDRELNFKEIDYIGERWEEFRNKIKYVCR